MSDTDKTHLRSLILSVPLHEHVLGYLKLKKNSHYYSGLCPFHPEKTPSFSVYPDHFHCFGCQAHGSLIDFEMKLKNFSFKEALNFLATKYAWNVNNQDFKSGNNLLQKIIIQEDPKIREAKNILQKVSELYERSLNSSNPCQDYIKERKIPESFKEQWKLGYAPKGNVLVSLARQRKWDFLLLKELGLIMEKDGKYWDFFRHRLMFPIFNHTGYVVGFGGRSLESDQKPKYLNSLDSPIFKKSSLLFNYDKAKTSIQKQKQVYIVEGYMDCLAMVKAGYLNTVAILGTALSAQHIQILSKISTRCTFMFDGDLAGQRAVYRSFKIGYPLGLIDFECIPLPLNEDPDSYLAQKASSTDMSKMTIPTWSYLYDKITENHHNWEAKFRALKTSLISIIQASPQFPQSEFIENQICERLGISSLKIQSISQQQKTQDQSKIKQKFPWEIKTHEELRFMVSLVLSQKRPDRLIQPQNPEYNLCWKALKTLVSQQTFEAIMKYVALNDSLPITLDHDPTDVSMSLNIKQDIHTEESFVIEFLKNYIEQGESALLPYGHQKFFSELKFLVTEGKKDYIDCDRSLAMIEKMYLEKHIASSLYEANSQELAKELRSFFQKCLKRIRT